MAEPGTGWGGVYQGFVAWLIGLDRVNSSGVADVMTDHDGRVHAFEIEYGNPRMKPCCNVVNVSTGDLTFFRLSGACERHCYAFCIGKADDKRINQLAGAAICSRIKNDFRNRGNCFLATDDLQFTENVER